MINPNELRLGITLYDNLRKKEVTIAKKHLRELLIDEASFVKRYSPIAITEEKLVKCGFEEVFSFWFSNGILLIEKFETKDFYTVNIREQGQAAKYLCKIKYLHQLQSLFVDLTKTELKYEL